MQSPFFRAVLIRSSGNLAFALFDGEGLNVEETFKSLPLETIGAETIGETTAHAEKGVFIVSCFDDPAYARAISLCTHWPVVVSTHRTGIFIWRDGAKSFDGGSIYEFVASLVEEAVPA